RTDTGIRVRTTVVPDRSSRAASSSRRPWVTAASTTSLTVPPNADRHRDQGAHDGRAGQVVAGGQQVAQAVGDGGQHHVVGGAAERGPTPGSGCARRSCRTGRRGRPAGRAGRG